MRSRLALRTARWLTGLTAALWMTARRLAAACRSLLANASPSPGAGSWTVYHGDPAGSGAAAPARGRVDTASPAWTSPALDGEIYGEPLVSAGRVYVATENDTVYALSAATGAVAWSRHLATPVPASSLPCGDIAPTVGITGTPVIDPARGEIFVVADEQVQGQPAHVLAGLSTSTGQVEMTRDVDPPGADTAALLQRTGLTLAGGRVVFGFGGNDGDCATYRGRVVAVPEAGGAPAMFTVDAKAGQSQGAVWMGGAAPAVDARVTSGSASGTVRCTRPRAAMTTATPCSTCRPRCGCCSTSRRPTGQRTTPGTSTCPPSRCCCPAARCCWPGSPASPTCSTAPTSAASAGSWPRWARPAAPTSTAAPP